MDVKDFGGTSVKHFDLGKLGKTLFGNGPYEYFFYNTAKSERIEFSDLQSFSLFVLSKPDIASVKIDGLSEELAQGDDLQSEGNRVCISVEGAAVQFLVAGTMAPNPEKKGVFITRNKDLYRVSKPWGHEVWLNGQHPCYALKEIFIKAGTKTSLQYHRQKQETNVLFKGTAKLHYKENLGVSNDEVKPQDLASTEINPISSIEVLPLTLHRLEAVSDILLYEISTPHLDDVVRVMDDNKRPDGRLETEHRN
jgi:mannose-6-phosphate isomerase